MIVLALFVLAQAGAPVSPPDRIRQAVDRVSPGVVTIETVGGVSPDTNGDPSRAVGEGPTTGLIFSTDGCILTSSFHFVRDPSVITVRLADGTRHTAKLLARDELRRLAMLRIPAGNLPVPTWAEQKSIAVGRTVIAVGCGLGGHSVSVSVGIVSGLNRMSSLAIQTDAKVSPINYGGPLIDLDGRVVGLLVPMSYSPGDTAGNELYDSGIGFAIPLWQAEPSALRLVQGETIRRGILGVRLVPVDGGGLRIESVVEASPAEAAGLKAGDLLTAIDDKPVRIPLDLQRRIAFREAGERVALTVIREGRMFYTDARLIDADKLRPENAPRKGR